MTIIVCAILRSRRTADRWPDYTTCFRRRALFTPGKPGQQIQAGDVGQREPQISNSGNCGSPLHRDRSRSGTGDDDLKGHIATETGNRVRRGIPGLRRNARRLPSGDPRKRREGNQHPATSSRDRTRLALRLFGPSSPARYARGPLGSNRAGVSRPFPLYQFTYQVVPPVRTLWVCNRSEASEAIYVP